ncbi:uncharacterized protein LOC119092552 [Pollicipes pollicipes]|uniref:uncharacterized protein LOC119092552 n=1 Tax=Pollicipes pollicipes TaxID=41117 RepID=UPI001885184F|nr:uncharacterized protein LOC119092552 [Pollicipes pollicipes]
MVKRHPGSIFRRCTTCSTARVSGRPNKLSRLHVQCKKNKMKVKIAAQLFSSSVGKALLYLEESGHHEFIGAGVTAYVILRVDQTFDYLNSSNPYGKGFKTPVTANNLMLRREFVADFSSVLFRLQTASGEPVLQMGRFTPVPGLCLATQTVMDIRRPKRQRPTLSESGPMPAVVQHLLTTEDTGSGFVDNCVGHISGYVYPKLVETGAIGCGICVSASTPMDKMLQ